MMSGMGGSKLGGIAEEVGAEDPPGVANAPSRYGPWWKARPLARWDLDNAACGAAAVDTGPGREFGEGHAGFVAGFDRERAGGHVAEYADVLEQRGIDGAKVECHAVLLPLVEVHQPASAGQPWNLTSCEARRRDRPGEIEAAIDHVAHEREDLRRVRARDCLRNSRSLPTRHVRLLAWASAQLQVRACSCVARRATRGHGGTDGC
jgi:hypothetical protein